MRSALYLLVGVLAGACLGACKFDGPPGTAPEDAPTTMEDAALVDMAPQIDAPACATTMPDEDGDGLADVCDSCPYVADAPTMDSDGDQIPDACDPHVNLADTRIAFEGFAMPPLPSSWQTLGPGTYAHIAGDFVITSGDTRDIVRIDTGSPHHTIEMSFTVAMLRGNNGSSVRSAAAIGDVVSTSDRFYLCGPRYDTQVRELWRFTSGSASLLESTPTTMVAPGTFHVRMTVEADSADCYVATSPTNVAHLPTTTNPAGDTGVGIRSRNVLLALHWVAIYTH